MQASLTIPAGTAARMAELLDPKKLQQATTAALNRTAAKGEKIIADNILADLNISRAELLNKGKKHRGTPLSVKRATYDKPEAKITISQQAIHLFRFRGGREVVVKQKQKGTLKGERAVKRMGVMAQPIKGRPLTLKHAFQVKMDSGHVGYFSRVKGAGRLPIMEHGGPSAYAAFVNVPNIQQQIVDRELPAELLKQLNSQPNRFLGRKVSEGNLL